VSFNPTDLVCCRTLQGHSGKVVDLLSHLSISGQLFCDFSFSFCFLVCNLECEMGELIFCFCGLLNLERGVTNGSNS
jgi:hypothetical protein